MANFRLDRFRYTWRGTWQPRIKYNPDDIISYGSKVYVSTTRHDAKADFYDDLNFFNNDIPPVLTPRWVLVADGTEWTGIWQAEKRYNVGDIARHGGRLYLCVVGHISAADSVTDQEEFISDNFDVDYLSSDRNYWVLFLNTDKWGSAWLPERFYKINDIVRYEGIVYRCIVSHVSTTINGGLEANSSDWEEVIVTDSWKDAWTVATRYKANDVVLYGGTIYRCIQGHDSSNNILEGLEEDLEKWEVLVSGFYYVGNFSADNVRYRINDVVKYGSYLYKCHTAHIAQEAEGFNLIYFDIFCPGQEYDVVWNEETFYQVGDIVRYGGYLYACLTQGAGIEPDPELDVTWRLLLRDTNVRGDWELRTQYQAGDVVRRNGMLYIAKQASIGEDTDIQDDESTMNADYWDVLIPGEKWRGIWGLDETYLIGDLVILKSTSYKCVGKHLSTENSRPDNDYDQTYWETYVGGNELNVLKDIGDVLTYGTQEDGSSIGNTAVNIGEDKSVLQSNGTTLSWEDVSESQKVYFVATNGVDSPTTGTTQNSPWRTLRYALENITGDATVFVRTGIFDEILPLRVPARVAVVGDELRSTVIRPGSPILTSDDIVKLRSMLTYFTEIGGYVVRNLPIGSLNEDDETFGTTLYGTVPQDLTGTAGDNDDVNILSGLLEQLNGLIGRELSVSNAGSNEITTDAAALNVRARLLANEQFILSELKGYLAATFPSYSIDATLLDRNLERCLSTLAYDIYYPGNFKVRDTATYFVNASNYDANRASNMFLLRDGTGLRNCTLSGLFGTLGDLNTYLTRRPTAGAYASLDPGWGPGDSESWVGSKSPYVQNVTTFGTGCVGLKIDGDLHSGGNQTIVANDFTQVLSDGIGVWANGTGRTECVSVFTYYNHIGYLCTFGGKIRGTNGNCSYGQYGAVAEGSNISEDPITATINNRYFDATISSTFTSGTGITKLFYSHAGNEYTEATYNVVGAGQFAELQGDEFRDGGVYENRIIDPGDSSPAGGGGYVFTTNTAQGGNDISLIIAGSDDNEPEVYRGMRIILTSGTGAGQYGYVAEYNKASKVLHVAPESYAPRPVESTTSAGNLITLDTTEKLNVDDRVIFTAETHFGNIQPYTVYYIKTVENGTQITISTTEGGDAFNLINETGDMEMHRLGFGHLTAGTEILTVLDTTTNYAIEPRIVYSSPGFSSSAIALSDARRWQSGAYGNGVVVLVADDGGAGTNVAAYSTDGSSWSETTMPVIAHWKKVAFGNNTFVAVGENGRGAYSADGENWTLITLPNTLDYTNISYGDGVWLATTSGTQIARSTDLNSWTLVNLPSGGDWIDVKHGKGVWVAITQSDSSLAETAYSEDGGLTWSEGSFSGGGISLAYGNGRFVAIEGGNAGANNSFISFDGIDWQVGTFPVTANFSEVTYNGGLFMAVAKNSSTAYVSEDGLVWTAQSISTSENWISVVWGNPDASAGTWFIIPGGDDYSADARGIKTGATAQARAVIVSGKMSAINIWEPGSGYSSDPIMVIVDPNNTTDVSIDVRSGNGVLGNPSIINRGVGYSTTSTVTTVSGDGFKDQYQIGSDLIVSNLSRIPGPGDNLNFSSIDDYTYKLLSATVLAGEAPNITARIRVAKDIDREESPEHGESLEIRQLYSQVRLTGHDFLLIGLGNFIQTNYPDTLNPIGTVFAPQDESRESNGGRVFYTSTDQDGNFRVGELFAVEQASGTVTLNAQFFQLEGLEELALGGVSVGGTGVVIREFSTDPTFTADSNNILPTQKAIKAYITSRVSGGGADANTGRLIAGVVSVGPDEITTTTGDLINVPVKVNFKGGIDGDWLAQSYYLHGNNL